MLAFEIRFRVQHHPVLTFLGAVIVFRSLDVLPLGFSEWKSVHVWVWEVYIAAALIVDHYYGYRVHGWNWLTSHTWADTCRCPQSQTPSERVRVRRETCDLFCLNKVWLLQMNSNCWYYRVIRVTHTHAHTESDLQTLSVSVTHTRAVTETLQIYTSTHKQTRMSRRHIHTPLLLRRFKTKKSCKILFSAMGYFSINQIKPLMMMMSDCPQRVKISVFRVECEIFRVIWTSCATGFFFYWG